MNFFNDTETLFNQYIFNVSPDFKILRAATFTRFAFVYNIQVTQQSADSHSKSRCSIQLQFSPWEEPTELLLLQQMESGSPGVRQVAGGEMADTMPKNEAPTE